MDKLIKVLKDIILGIALGMFAGLTLLAVSYAAFNLLVELIRLFP